MANQPLTSVTKKSIPNVNRVLDKPLVKLLKKTHLNEIKQDLVWSRFVGNGLAVDHKGLVINSPLQMPGKRPVWSLDTTSYLELLLLTY